MYIRLHLRTQPSRVFFKRSVAHVFTVRNCEIPSRALTLSGTSGVVSRGNFTRNFRFEVFENFEIFTLLGPTENGFSFPITPFVGYVFYKARVNSCIGPMDVSLCQAHTRIVGIYTFSTPIPAY